MSRHDGGENCPGWCGRFEIFMVALVFSVGFSILWCCCTTKRDQENLEMIEGQDQVIKTYQIAKMIMSGTAFENSQFTILQTRLHFVCIS